MKVDLTLLKGLNFDVSIQTPAENERHVTKTHAILIPYQLGAMETNLYSF